MNALEFTKAYFNVCSDLGEKPEDVVVSAGGALLILGLREEVTDLNLDVRDIVYEAKKFGHKEQSSSHGAYIEMNAMVSLHKRREGVKTMRVRGVYIYTPDELLKQKKALAEAPDRPSDKRRQDLIDMERLHWLLDSSAHP
jgi:hypothetical protein